jgi:hypothetical protein
MSPPVSAARAERTGPSHARPFRRLTLRSATGSAQRADPTILFHAWQPPTEDAAQLKKLLSGQTGG